MPITLDPTQLEDLNEVLNGASFRELARHYAPASEADVSAMLDAVGIDRIEDLFRHIPAGLRFSSPPDLPEELTYAATPAAMSRIAAKNCRRMSFIGDGLPDVVPSPVVGPICEIRKLATAYTPYQPELSQGTLVAHWIYQCTMARLTGFEAINASLYDRSTAVYEGIAAAMRMGRDRDVALVGRTVFPGDIEVLETLAAGTPVRLEFVDPDPRTGRLDPATVEARAAEIGDRLAAVVFPQVNTFGLPEEVDLLTDLAARCGARSVAAIDPLLLGPGGLKQPSRFGAAGCDIIVGEAQHLALGPNFGGPGLGLFGVRFDASNRAGVRAAPGRFIGKARDIGGRECRVGVLSTREQHIRKEKATSNICSNQAFVATLVGAALLERGDEGLAAILATVRDRTAEAVDRLTRIAGVRLAFPDSAPFHEVTFEVDTPVAEMIEGARCVDLHLGVDVSDRVPGSRHLLKLSFSNRDQDIERLASVLSGLVAGDSEARPKHPQPVAARLLRDGTPGIRRYGRDELVDYYRRLGELNVSPDDGCYPLGSCTMKYNPRLNEWAAALPGFADLHPQVPLADAQGSLEVLYEVQQWFKAITGLAAVTTQPVAGAQGELVGLKLFQAYHRDRGRRRDVILIPRSSHGTNFATATMAGFTGEGGRIVYLEAASNGCVALEQLDSVIAEYGERIAGVMITNPNTSGIFEAEFREIADRIHAIGALVYMDGANMNAIAGWVDLGALDVDAVHNNLHKTWSIPHGGGGPGDAIVAVSERLADYLPGMQIERFDGGFRPVKPPKSIGSVHRHWGNFAHKVRCYTYLLRLGREGVRRMSALAVLSARYLHQRLGDEYATLPADRETPRMHEFIITLKEEDFAALERAGVRRVEVAQRIGKLFLDFGFHAPTVSWPEPLGLMIEPTECYTKAELDRFGDAVLSILELLRAHPGALENAPRFTPIDRVDETAANREVCLNEDLQELPELPETRVSQSELARMPLPEIHRRIVSTL